MTVLFAALLTAQGRLDPAGNLWSWIQDQGKSFWYIGVVVGFGAYLLSRRKEAFGHMTSLAIAAGVAIFCTPALGSFITALGNRIF